MKTTLDQGQLLSQLQKLSELAKSGASQANREIANSGNIAGSDKTATAFGNLLSNAIDNVNHLQTQSANAATAVESGDGGVSLVKAMIASQKASVAFQATVQVRNKLVSAYQDIMNMPI